MKDKIEKIKIQFDQDLSKAKDSKDLEQLDINYLGRKSGKLTELMKDLKSIPKEEIAGAGKSANELKQYISLKLEEYKNKLGGSDSSVSFDYTLPGAPQPEGHLHLVTQAIDEIVNIFKKIGFQRERYPEVEWDYYAFETLNMPGDHPARDEWETFFIDPEPIEMNLSENSLKLVQKGRRILTPHTSNGQVREMEKKKLPIRMINITKCYRRQIDISHTPMFHQFEGLVVDKGINITHLKGAIEYFVKNFFGEDIEIRLRPHHFQFTEPSFEIDITCVICKGKGCKTCKDGWVELGGSGIVHPNVLKSGGVDPKVYSGFAFGWGIERCLAMKPGTRLDDIRLLYKNDLRFLKQF